MAKPSSAAFSRSVWIPPEEGTGLEMTKDVETEPFSDASAVALTLTGVGIWEGGGSIFPFKSLITYNRNPSS